MPKKFTPKIAAALKKAWEAGSINLCDVCPSCFKHMSYMDHGKCPHCKQSCGCSFSPTSSSDYCDFHCPF